MTTRHRSSSLVRVRLATLAAAAALALGLASCAAQEAADTESSEAEYAAWQNDYDNCLREQGVEPPSVGDALDEAEAEAYEAAMQTCDEQVGQMPGSGGAPDADQLKQIQESVECLREQGLEVEDPDPADGSITLPSEATPEQLAECGLQTM